MRNVLLLGASGTLGKAVTEKLLSETDLKLTLFARHATDVYTEGKATVIDGDATESDTLKDAMVNQDVIVCMVSGEQLPEVAKNIVACMDSLGKRRLIFMGAVGIYNEIPDVMDGEDNVDNNPDQVPNRKAVDIIEASDLEYTVLRPGYLREGQESDYVLSFKGEAANGYFTSIPSLVNLIQNLIEDDNLYRRESVSITKDMR
ncbi:MAG: NAD(P)H-binding protein [Eubacteriales bacterium]|nr:NAD(P)H-binding protein [Eubacteriales bacterium]